MLYLFYPVPMFTSVTPFQIQVQKPLLLIQVMQQMTQGHDLSGLETTYAQQAQVKRLLMAHYLRARIYLLVQPLIMQTVRATFATPNFTGPLDHI